MGALAWLKRPARLRARARRRHMLVLGLLVVLGFARGAYWSAATPVWSPIDEIAHFGYVQSLAEGHGVPVIGRDLISNDVIVAAKQSPTSVYRGQPFQATDTDANWGAVRQQYEATAGPVYYALMVVPFWIGRPFGLTGELFAIRLATVMLGLAMIPLTWALTRRLFPSRPPVWLVAAAFVTLLNSLAFGAVANDSLSVVLACAAVLALLRAAEGKPTPANVALAGGLVGLGIVTKATTLTVAPLLMAVAITWWLRHRPTIPEAAKSLAWYMASAALVIAPWLLWNLTTYHALSGVRAVTRALQPTSSAISLARIGSEIGAARWGLWSNQLIFARGYEVLWFSVLSASVIAALAVSWHRQRVGDAFAVALCGAALPLAFVVSELIDFTVEGGDGSPIGRHLLPAVPFAVIGIAGGLGVVVTRRWLPIAAGMLISLGLLIETRATFGLFHRSYERTVFDTALVPVAQQGWSDHLVAAAAIQVSPVCPVTAVWLGFAQAPPATLMILTGGRSWTVRSEAVSSSLPLYLKPTLDTAWYRLPAELTQPFTIELPPGAMIDASATDRVAGLSFVGAGGDPVGRLYCRRPDARAVAFAMDYPPGHPAGLPRQLFYGFPIASTGLAACVTIGGAALATRARARARA